MAQQNNNNKMVIDKIVGEWSENVIFILLS